MTNWDYDNTVNAMYVRTKQGLTTVKKTVEVKPGIFLDFDADGDIVGVEILDCKRI